MEQGDMTKEEKFLMQILRGTQNGTIKWIPKRVESFKNSIRTSGNGFETEINRRVLSIFKKGQYTGFSRFILAEAEWNTVVNLGFKDPEGNLAYWEFSSSEYSIIRNIYNEIIRKESRIDDYMDEISKLDI